MNCTFGCLPCPVGSCAVQVRGLASAQAQDGTVDSATLKFVRHQKTTMLELQRRSAERAQQIMEKQARAGGRPGGRRRRRAGKTCARSDIV